MSRRILASVLLPVFLWVPAHAQESAAPPATAQAAPDASADVARLREMLAAFVTDAPFEQGILRIESDPAGQRITLDPAPILTKWFETAVRFAPVSIVVRERQDGNWDVSSNALLDFSASFEIGGETQRFEYREDSQRFEGVFSPELATFLSGEGRSEGITNETHEPTGSSVSRIGSATTTVNAVPGATGGADIEFRQVFEAYSQTSAVTIPLEEGAAEPTSFGFEVTAGAVESTGIMIDARTAAIRDLYALALRGVPALKADAQAALAGPFGTELKTAIQALLPLWQSLEGSAVARDLAVTTAFGNFKLGEARQTMRVTGVDTDAALDIDMSFAGLQVESAMVPEWAVPLLPGEIAMGFGVSGLDLATPAALALEELDFTQDPPLSQEAQARVAATFDPAGIETRLKPGFIRSDEYDITFSGDFTFADNEPQAVFTVEASGIDAVIERMRVGAASDPSLNEAIGILQFAKGMARPGENGRSIWTILAAPDGSVSVNDLVVQGPTEPETPAEDPTLPEDELETPAPETAPAPEAEEDAGQPEADTDSDATRPNTNRNERRSLEKAPLDATGGNDG